MPTEMSIEEFNSRLSLNTNEFVTRIMELSEEFCKRNSYAPSDRLLIILYSGISVTRELNTEIWKIGENYMIDVLTKIKELKTDAD